MQASLLTYGFFAAALGGYVLGSIPFGLLLTRMAGFGDVRLQGSKSIGATNVLRVTKRKDLALATLLLDSVKGAIALLLAREFLGPNEALIAGGAAFFGHCFSVFLKFNGGKGVATFFGTLFAGMPLVGAGAGVAWLIVYFVFRFSSLAGLTAAASAPLLAYLFHGSVWEIGFCMVLAVLIFWRHQANIGRLLRGEEPRIGAGKAQTDEG
jgi:acyl phosphate:glycerol-3-phosphate acyltransferase